MPFPVESPPPMVAPSQFDLFNNKSQAGDSASKQEQKYGARGRRNTGLHLSEAGTNKPEHYIRPHNSAYIRGYHGSHNQGSGGEGSESLPSQGGTVLTPDLVLGSALTFWIPESAQDYITGTNHKAGVDLPIMHQNNRTDFSPEVSWLTDSLQPKIAEIFRNYRKNPKLLRGLETLDLPSFQRVLPQEIRALTDTFQNAFGLEWKVEFNRIWAKTGKTLDSIEKEIDPAGKFDQDAVWDLGEKLGRFISHRLVDIDPEDARLIAGGIFGLAVLGWGMRKYPKVTQKVLGTIITLSMVAGCAGPMAGSGPAVTEVVASPGQPTISVVEPSVVKISPTVTPLPSPSAPIGETPTILPGGPNEDNVVNDEGPQIPVFDGSSKGKLFRESTIPEGESLKINVKQQLDTFRAKLLLNGYSPEDSLDALTTDNSVFVTAIDNEEQKSYRWTVFGVTRKGFLMPLDKNNIILGDPSNVGDQFDKFLVVEDGYGPDVLRQYEEYGGKWIPIVRDQNGHMLAYYDYNFGWVFKDNLPQPVQPPVIEPSLIPTEISAPTPTESPYETRPEILAVYAGIEAYANGFYESGFKCETPIVEDMQYILKDPVNADAGNQQTLEASMYDKDGDYYGETMFFEGKLRAFKVLTISDDPKFPQTIFLEMGDFSNAKKIEMTVSYNRNGNVCGSTKPESQQWTFDPRRLDNPTLKPLVSVFTGSETPEQYLRKVIFFNLAVNEELWRAGDPKGYLPIYVSKQGEDFYAKLNEGYIADIIRIYNEISNGSLTTVHITAGEDAFYSFDLKKGYRVFSLDTADNPNRTKTSHFRLGPDGQLDAVNTGDLRLLAGRPNSEQDTQDTMYILFQWPFLRTFNYGQNTTQAAVLLDLISRIYMQSGIRTSPFNAVSIP